VAFVIDASVAASWAFKDETHPIADAAKLRLLSEDVLAPGLWWFEVRNALVVNERRGRLQEADTKIFLADLEVIAVIIDRAPDESEIFDLSRRHRLTFYDAAYLELASRLNAPLATTDKKLAAATLAENIPLLQAP